MSEQEQLVKYKILDTTGFSTHQEPASKALSEIKAYLERKGGWFYIDKVLTHIETTTVEDVKNASILTITNVIIGGEDDANSFDID